MANMWYDTIDGKWWLFCNGKARRPLTDSEVAQAIWGSGLDDLQSGSDEIDFILHEPNNEAFSEN